MSAKKKHLLVFCSAWMLGKPRADGWKISLNTQEHDADFTSEDEKFGPTYVREIERLKPDFVLAINVGCSEQKFDAMEKPKGPKYITWSVDSYHHAKRCTTSDLHLSGINDDAIEEGDHYMPLFHQTDQHPRFFKSRKHRIGIHCRPWTVYRQKELEKAKEAIPDLQVTQRKLHPIDYIDVIRDYQYGLNICVYPDSYENFRLFELGAHGVMPCYVGGRGLAAMGLTNGYIRAAAEYEAFSESQIPYDPLEVQGYYNTFHSFQARLERIFREYFDIDFSVSG